jgi:hypothetical protein
LPNFDSEDITIDVYQGHLLSQAERHEDEEDTAMKLSAKLEWRDLGRGIEEALLASAEHSDLAVTCSMRVFHPQTAAPAVATDSRR